MKHPEIRTATGVGPNPLIEAITQRLPIISGETLVEARGVSRHFGALVAVDGVSLSVRQGEVFGFLGPNGAGKSTLFRMLMGLMAPTVGTIEVLGLRLPRDADRVRDQVGYMAQRFALYEDLTVQENLEFAAEIFGMSRSDRRRRVEEQLENFGLQERRRQRSGTLSGGWKQRLALSVASVHEPRLLLLDEPTAGVDPESRRQFWEEIFKLASSGTTILVSTHYMDEAVRCHRLCLMLAGRRVAEGSPSALEAQLAGRVLEIQSRRVTEVIDCLQGDSQVASITQLGNRAHVLLKPGTPMAGSSAERLDGVLRSSGLEGQSVPSDPTLEDVFVAVTMGEDLGGVGR